MNAAVSQLVVMLVMMQVSRRLDLENEHTVNLVRIAYVVSNLVILGLYLYTKSVINKKKDLTTLKYVDQGSPFAPDTQNQHKTTTVHQYDLDQINGALKGLLQNVAMMGFMHLYMKYTNPLVMQSVLPLKGALEQKEVMIHVFGKNASGDLKRPFKTASLFGGLTGNSAADEKTAQKAEAAGKGGIKQD